MFSLLLSCKSTQAESNIASQSVVFSEIGWAGSSNSTSDEWFELKNITNQNISLEDWQVEIDGGNSPIILVLTGEIQPGQTLLYSRQSPGSPKTTVVTALAQPVAPIQSISRSLSLPNDNLRMVLTDNLGQIVDVAGNSESNLAGSTAPKASQVRKYPITNGSSKDSWYTANYSEGFIPGVADFGTPGLENISLPINQNITCNPNRLVFGKQNYITCQGDITSNDNSLAIAQLSINDQDYPLTIIDGHWQWNGSVLANKSTLKVSITATNLAGSIQSDTLDLNSYQTSQYLLINELMPNPSAGPEWIEIYNEGDQPIDLSGWSLDDAGAIGSKPYFFDNGTILESGEYLVINQDQSSIALNNTGDDVNLIDPFDRVVNMVSFGQTTVDSSYSRSNERSFLWNKFITPSQENYFGPQVNYPGNVKINEFIPNPSGSDMDNEWIELKNDNDFMVDLSNWQVDDGPKGSEQYLIPAETKINPNSLLVLSRSQTKISLNNNTDSVRLFWPNNKTINEVNYANAKSGYSYALINNTWTWTNRPTPGAENLGSITIEKPPKSKKDKKPRNKSPGDAQLSNQLIIQSIKKVKKSYPPIILPDMGQVKGAQTQRLSNILIGVDISAILFFLSLLSLNIWLNLKKSNN